MKVFKRVYYAVMAAMFVLLLAFSIADANVGTYKLRFDDSFYTNVEGHITALSDSPRNDYNGASLDAARDYIVDELGGTLFIPDVFDDTDGVFTSTPESSSGTPVGVVQRTVLSKDTQANFAEGDKLYVYKTVENIVFYVPGTDTKANKPGDVVMFTAHYDSVGNGAMGNASSVAVMIENIKHIIGKGGSGLTFKNDLLFVFTDAHEQGSLGDYAFYYQFKGFDNVVSRIKACFDFSSFGNGGSLAMYSASGASKLVASYTAVNNGTFISSALTAFLGGAEYTETHVYGDIPSLAFANIGGNTHNSAADVAGNVKMNVVKQSADMMFKIYDRFGSADLGAIQDGENAVFFSYLDVFSVAFPSFVSYIIAGVIIILAAVVFVANRKKKSFGVLNALAGAGAHLLTVLASMIVLFGIYFLVTLLLSGFGVIAFKAAISLVFTNVGIIVTSFILAGAVMTAFYIVLKKAFNIKASDVVRGSALVNALAAVVLCFVVPQFGYIFSFMAMLQLAVMLYTVFHKESFKAKRKMDIERLFLYVWPVILCLPLLIPVIVLGASVTKAVLLPVVLLLFMLPAGAIIPYSNYLKPLMDKLALKMPKRSVRYEEEVTERVEDKAKKGKFKEVTSVKVLKRKVDRVYKNRIGVAIVTALCIVSFVLFSAFNGDLNANFTGDKTFDNYVYDRAIVYVWDQDASSSVRTTVQIKDLNAYNYYSRFVVDYEWDETYGAFVKDLYTSVLGSGFSAPVPTLSDKTYTFRPYEIKSAITIKMTGIKDITLLTFTRELNNNDPEEIEFENTDSTDEYTFVIPFGWGEFKMTYEGTANGITFEYTETIFDSAASNQLKDVMDVKNGFDAEGYPENYESSVRSGIIIKYTKTM